jgi:phosphoserine aminotransferase
MNSIYFTAGPTQLYPSYRKHLSNAMDLQFGSINHRSEAFRKIYQHTDEQLRQLLNVPKTHSIFFASSATEIWEKMILNLVETTSYHFVNGAFSQKFYDFSLALHKQAVSVEVEEGNGFEINQIQIPNDIELICTTQNETSTGVQFPVNDFKTIKKNNPNSLLCTDLVSIAPYSEIDYSIVDSSFFSVQKAFGMPPGLGVWIVNEACMNKAENLMQKGLNCGAHNTLLSYSKNYKTFETPSTPNVVAIYILGKIAEEMNKMGVATIRNEIDAKAKLLYSMIGIADFFSIFVRDKKFQSPTVAVFDTSISSIQIINHLKQKEMLVSNGYGKGKDKQIRIANFPSTTLDNMEKLIEEINRIV